MGVRAYQWGWEYYYPKSIDLNYNVKPSYSSFIGNSLKYNYASGHTLSSQTLWRMYQNKDEDSVITPAHVLFTPITTMGVLNFSNIGVNTLQEAYAFSKIRNSTKTYNTHLAHAPSIISNRYTKLQSLYFNENNFLQTSSFAVKPQHTLLSTRSVGNYYSASSLDKKSFHKFVQTGFDLQDMNAKHFQDTGSLSLINPHCDLSPLKLQSQDSLLADQLVQPHESTFLNFLRVMLYPTISMQLNNDSDKSISPNPLLKVASYSSLKLNYSQINKAFISTQTQNMTSYSFPMATKLLEMVTPNSRQFNLNGPNSKVLLGEQSIRSSLPNVPQTPDLNLSSTMNSFVNNKNSYTAHNRPFNIFLGALLNENSYIDYPLFNNLLTSQPFNSNAQSAIHSLNPESLNSLEHDTTTSKSVDLRYKTEQGLTFTKEDILTSVGDLFVGSREKTPKSLNTSY